MNFFQWVGRVMGVRWDQRKRRSPRPPLRLESLEARALLAHALAGQEVWLDVSFAERGEIPLDLLTITYEGPAGTFLHDLGLLLEGSAGEVRIDTDEPGFGFGDPCGVEVSCGPVPLEARGILPERVRVTAPDGGGLLGVQFSSGSDPQERFDPGDRLVIGLDFDRTDPAGSWEVRGEDLAGALLVGVVGGPMLPTVPILFFEDTGTWTAEATGTRTIPEPPLTVVTHGWQPARRPPAWMAAVRQSLLNRGFHDEEVLLWSWATTSNIPSPGWAEAAGEQLFAEIVRRMLQERERAFTVHFIGHSRGAVVVSEAVERLVALRAATPEFGRRIRGIQLTFLDPHPARAGVPFTSGLALRSLVEAVQEAMDDPLPVAWRGVRRVDVYAQRTTEPCGGADALFNLHGLFGMTDAYTEDVSVLTFPDGHQETLCHTDVPAFYQKTIDQAEDWYRGWYFSIGTQTALLAPVVSLPGAVPAADPFALFNGDFRFTDAGTKWRQRALRFLLPAPRGSIPGFSSRNTSFPEGVAVLRRGGTITRELAFVRPGAQALSLDLVRSGQSRAGLRFEIWLRDRVAAQPTWQRLFEGAVADLPPGRLTVPLLGLDVREGAVVDLAIRLTGKGGGTVTLDALAFV